MSTLFISFFNGLFFAIYCYLVGIVILKKREKNLKKVLLGILYFFIVYYLMLFIFESIPAIFFAGIYAFLFIRTLFKETIFVSLFLTVIIHTYKSIFKFIILLILQKKDFLLINTTYHTLTLEELCINITAFTLSFILIVFIRDKLQKLIKYVSSIKHRELVLLILIYIVFIIILVLQNPVPLIDLDALSDILFIFTITGVGVFNSSSEMKMEDLNKYYQDIFEYSKANEELLYNYKMQVHENKNKLLMIKGMLESSKDDAQKYIEGILKEINRDKNNTNYWLTELKYIPLAGVRNFINYKLVELRNIGAQIEVFVSSELEKVDASYLSNKEYNQLSTILGVILDNMIDAVKNIEKKLISINLYIEDDKIHGEFVNNFSGEIDLVRLYEIGYTTKGEQNGVGLPLVAKITKTNKRFKCKPKIIDNFFVQHLTIKIYNEFNIQKIKKN